VTGERASLDRVAKRVGTEYPGNIVKPKTPRKESRDAGRSSSGTSLELSDRLTIDGASSDDSGRRRSRQMGDSLTIDGASSDDFQSTGSP